MASELLGRADKTGISSDRIQAGDALVVSPARSASHGI